MMGGFGMGFGWLWGILLLVLVGLAIAALIVALARPQFVEREQEIRTEGIDIMLALDISGSMRAEDFKPKDRLFVAKNVVIEFLDLVGSDRIGLVVFEVSTGRSLAGHRHDEGVQAMAVSPDGRQVAVGYEFRTVRLLDAESLEEISSPV